VWESSAALLPSRGTAIFSCRREGLVHPGAKLVLPSAGDNTRSLKGFAELLKKLGILCLAVLMIGSGGPKLGRESAGQKSQQWRAHCCSILNLQQMAEKAGGKPGFPSEGEI
jgi:hypothetical protein